MKTARLFLLIASCLSFTPLSWAHIADGSVFDVKQPERNSGDGLLSDDQKKTLRSIKKKFERLATKRLAEEKLINDQRKAIIEALRSHAMNPTHVMNPTDVKIEVGEAQSFLIPPGPNYGTKYEWYAETKTQLCKGTLFLKVVKVVKSDGQVVFDSIVPVDCYKK